MFGHMTARRLLLFDIDGTLVKTGDISRVAFDRAIEAVLGETPTQRVRMGGKTDPQIVREYLALIDSDDPSHLPAVLEHLELQLAEAAEQLGANGSPCPGVAAPAALPCGRPRLHLSVLTGNIAPNAVVEVVRVRSPALARPRDRGLRQRQRGQEALVPIALERLAALRRPRLGPGDVWVIGDTPRDYECAQAGGAHCLLVATGGYGEDRLRSLGADAVLPDLADTGAVVAVC